MADFNLGEALLETKEKNQQTDDTHGIIVNMNEKHAFCMVQGKARVMTFVKDHQTGWPTFSLSSVHDFRNLYLNELVPDPEKPGKFITIANLWLKSPDRRQYGGIVFAPYKKTPGFYNMFQKLPVNPVQGDWSLWKNHLLDNVCSGNKDHFEWIMSWMARIVQDPGGNKPGTAVVLRGQQGVGKGIFATIFGKLLGPHWQHIMNQHQIVGRFNSILKDKILVFVDESFFAGSRAEVNILKGLITEPDITIELKGVDCFTIRNYMNLIIASNSDWVVSVVKEERRFFVLDVANTKRQNHEYFGAIIKQMAAGGLQALMFDLLCWQRNDQLIQNCPRTNALWDQITFSMSTAAKFFFERLRDQSLDPVHDFWEGQIETRSFYEDYIQFAKNIGDRYPLTDRMLGREVRSLCPTMVRARPVINGKRAYVYRFPELDVCRKEFEQTVKINVNWDEFDETVPF